MLRMILTAAVIIVVVSAIGFSILTADRCISPDSLDIGTEAAGAKVVDFLQVRLGVNYPGIKVDLVEAKDFKNISGTYEVVVKITFQGQAQDVSYFVTKDGNYLYTGVADLNEPFEIPQQQEDDEDDQGGIKSDRPENTAIQTFYDSGEDICYEDGKPIVRMYASSSCGYCRWNKPMYEKVVREYMDAGKIVAYLWEDGKNILSDEQETQPQEETVLYQKYGFSGVPAFVFGCKYYRSGASFSRAENGTVLEEAELRTVIEDLLNA